MGMFEKNTQDMQNPEVAVPHSEIILNELRTGHRAYQRTGNAWVFEVHLSPHGSEHQIRYVLIPEPDEIPRYVEVLREDFGKV
jgi:hypothetical protein